MKRVITSSVKHNQPVQGAQSVGTIFYKITDKLLKDVYRSDENFVMRYLVDTNEFQAFDLENMYGSWYDDKNNVFYLLVTDGKGVEFEGEEIDPEKISDKINSEDEIKSFIQDGTDTIVKQYFSAYELNPIDVDKVAEDLIKNGNLFTDTIKELNELDLLDLDSIL